ELPGHLHGRLRRAPRGVRPPDLRQVARPPGWGVFVQYGGRTLRPLRGGRLGAGGDVLPRRPAGALRGLRGRALQARGAGRAGPSLCVLAEPTVGLHWVDVQRLLEVLDDLTQRGDTVVLVEHNTDVVRCSDWVVDLGPDGGDAGGELVAEGSPDAIAACEASH